MLDRGLQWLDTQVPEMGRERVADSLLCSLAETLLQEGGEEEQPTVIRRGKRIRFRAEIKFF